MGTHFYNPAEGGDALLFQHLFWFFGHPEVYIIFVPALGMVSSIIVAFTQRPIFGYIALVLSLIATGFLGFGLWVHHMFTTGLLGVAFALSPSPIYAVYAARSADPVGGSAAGWPGHVGARGDRPHLDRHRLVRRLARRPERRARAEARGTEALR